MSEKLMQMIDDEINDLYKQMKDLDRQYIEKQKRVRELKKAKAALREDSDN